MKIPVSFTILTQLEPGVDELIKWAGKYFDQVLVLVDKRLKQQAMDRLSRYSSVDLVGHNIKDNFASLRQLSYRYAKNHYLFFVDSDERVVIDDKDKFRNFWHNLVGEVYKVYRYEVLAGRYLKYGESQFHARIVKKGVPWQGMVHERPDYPTGLVKPVEGFYLIHKQPRDVAKLIDKLNYYSDLRAREIYDAGLTGGLVKITVYPAAKLVQNLIIRQGIRDGWLGLFQAFLMAYYSLMTQVKLYLLSGKQR